MRVVALIAAHNERRFIDACLRHLERHGVGAYLIDNCSTDNTMELARRWLDRNLIGIESYSRDEGVYDWRGLLARKQELARELAAQREADWVIHLDPDEVRLPPPGERTLADALASADRAGYNAVDFREFTFMPSREEPDHDHAEYAQTLRTYYPFAPCDTNQLNAWKAAEAVELTGGGHTVRFPGLKVCPERFPMKHYLFLSVPHAIEKYVERRYDEDEVAGGWHGWRANLTADDIRLPSADELRISRSDGDLDPSDPRKSHYIDKT